MILLENGNHQIVVGIAVHIADDIGLHIVFEILVGIAAEIARPLAEQIHQKELGYALLVLWDAVDQKSICHQPIGLLVLSILQRHDNIAFGFLFGIPVHLPAV